MVHCHLLVTGNKLGKLYDLLPFENFQTMTYIRKLRQNPEHFLFCKDMVEVPWRPKRLEFRGKSSEELKN